MNHQQPGLSVTIPLQLTVHVALPVPCAPPQDTRRRLLFVSADEGLVQRFRDNFSLNRYPERMRYQSARDSIEAGAALQDFRPHLLLVDSQLGLDNAVGLLRASQRFSARAAVLAGSDELGFFSQYSVFERLPAGENHCPLVEQLGRALLN